MISSRLLCIRYTPGLAGSFFSSSSRSNSIRSPHFNHQRSLLPSYRRSSCIWRRRSITCSVLSFLFPAAGPKTERYSPVLSVLHGLPSVLIQPADLPGSQRPENVPAIRGPSVLLVAGSDHILPDCRWPAYFHFSQFIHLSWKYLLKTVFLLHIRIFFPVYRL